MNGLRLTEMDLLAIKADTKEYKDEKRRDGLRVAEEVQARRSETLEGAKTSVLRLNEASKILFFVHFRWILQDVSPIFSFIVIFEVAIKHNSC